MSFVVNYSAAAAAVVLPHGPLSGWLLWWSANQQKDWCGWKIKKNIRLFEWIWIWSLLCILEDNISCQLQVSTADLGSFLEICICNCRLNVCFWLCVRACVLFPGFWEFSLQRSTEAGFTLCQGSFSGMKTWYLRNLLTKSCFVWLLKSFPTVKAEKWHIHTARNRYRVGFHVHHSCRNRRNQQRLQITWNVCVCCHHGNQSTLCRLSAQLGSAVQCSVCERSEQLSNRHWHLTACVHVDTRAI